MVFVATISESCHSKYKQPMKFPEPSKEMPGSIQRNRLLVSTQPTSGSSMHARIERKKILGQKTWSLQSMIISEFVRKTVDNYSITMKDEEDCSVRCRSHDDLSSSSK